MKRWWMLAAIAAAGCEAGIGDVDGESQGFQDDIDVDGDGTPDTLGDPDVSFDGNLSDGEGIDVGWADDSGVFCWVATENENFDGNHVIFNAEKEGSGNIVVQVDPESGVDVSLYVLEYPPGSEETPPNVTSPSRCEAMFDDDGTGNPGASEAIPLIGFPDRNMVIGVAGAHGASSGAFTVGIWIGEGGDITDDTDG